MAAVFSLHKTFGAMFIGVVMAATLLGVSLVQSMIYYTRYPKDPWYVKVLVAVVLACDIIHQALITHTIYMYTITYYGVPAELGHVEWSLIVEVLFNGFTALLVQSFLSLRVWRLSNRNIPITAVVLLLVFGEFASLLAYVAKSIRFTALAELVTLKQLSITVNALAAIGDVLIAAVLCTMLHRSRTGFNRSDTMINKLIMFSVNTGLLTSVCAVASLISILVAGNTFVYICFFFCIGRLYSNSLLATLNARNMIRAAVDQTENFTHSLKDVSRLPNMRMSQGVGQGRWGGRGAGTAFDRPVPTQIAINITNTEEYDRDYSRSKDADNDTSTTQGTEKNASPHESDV